MYRNFFYGLVFITMAIFIIPFLAPVVLIGIGFVLLIIKYVDNLADEGEEKN